VTEGRVVVWIPSGDPGWTLEEARPYQTGAIGGGVRTLYEVAAAIAGAGQAVELRGVVSVPEFDEICAAAGARPHLPDQPRLPAASDTVIVPEGIEDPAVHARLALSPARVVLLILGPPGLFGWPFGSGWSPPDPLTVALDAVARPEHFRAAAALGFELWTHTPGLKRAAEEAGVACRFIGNGVPGGYRHPPPKDIDVLWLPDNRWGPLARPVARRLSELGVECVPLPNVSHDEVLELFGRARIVLHPLRIEGHSRVGCEARAMGAVPVVLDSPYAVGLDEGGGAVSVASVSQMADAVLELLAEPERLARLSANGRRSARRQVEWGPFVERVAAALAEPGDDPARDARATVGGALLRREDEAARRLERQAGELDHVNAGLERHKDWLDSINASLSWRLTAPLRAAKRWVSKPRRAAPEPHRSEEGALGRIEWPPDGIALPRAPVDVHGWCLFQGSNVARVEMRINGGPVELARPAMEVPTGGYDNTHPDAPICGFEHKADLAELNPGAETVRIEVLVRAVDGRELQLDPVEYALGPAPEVRKDGEGAYAELRARSAPFARVTRLRHAAEVRLLVFTHTLGYGGGSLYVLELVRRLVSQSAVRCELVSLADGPLRQAFEDAGIPVHVTDGSPVTSAARYEGHIAELLAWTGRREFDAVLANTLGAFAGVDLATRLGIPAVWAVHESFTLPMFWFSAYPRETLHPYVREQAEQALRKASAVLFMAEATRQLFVRDAHPQRLVTLPYGVELEAIDAARQSLDPAATRRRLGLEEHARVVLCLGSIEPRKSQATLAQAFAQIADRHPHAQLLLVGATEDAYSADYRASLREYVARAGLGERVRIEAVTDDPLSWHAVADVLVCASDIESLPRAIAEAMAFGTPVLSTRVYGVPELIEDGVHGFLCEMRDVGELARGLDRVLSMQPEQLGAVARAGFDRVRARHDPDAYAADVLRLLKGLVADREALPLDLLAGAAAQPGRRRPAA
jgi:glycosyltransferase involved in cell wall biosynthesis